MTREEAKRRMEICRDFLANNYSDMGEPNFTAFNMAIKALSQEPCDDAVSREELLKAISTWDKFGVDDTNSLFRLDNLSLPHYVPYIHYDDVIKCIKGMPSVTQKSETVTEFADRCRECGARYGKLLEQKSEKWIDGVHAMGYREGYKDAQKQKSGKWMLSKEKSHFFDVYECSNCGKISGLTNYCPNCGAKMESEEQG